MEPKKYTFSFFKKYIDTGVGFVLGAVVTISFVFLLKSNKLSMQNDSNNFQIETKASIDTLRYGKYTIEINQKSELKVKEQNEIIEEKLSSFKERLSDFYVALSVILVLVLFIFGAVYFKTEHEVSRHMHNNYNKYKEEILEMHSEAQRLLVSINTTSELLNSEKSKTTPTQTIIQPEPATNNPEN